MSWLEFCHDHNIQYKKVSRENIEVACWFCGPAHTNHKLGLNTVTGEFGCWRDDDARGKNPVRAVQAYLKCDWGEARVLTERYFNWRFEHSQNQEKVAPSPIVYIEKPAQFYPFGFNAIVEQPFVNYLKKRNFDTNYIIPRFKLHWSMWNKYIYRLIIPVMVNQQWYTWTARAIHNDSSKRYIAGSVPEETPNKITDFLFDRDNLTEGNTLIITEGCMDAMRITTAFIPGVQATALFSQQLTERQLLTLIDIAPNYDQVLIALDQDAMLHTNKIFSRLKMFIPNIGTAYPTKKDWAEMSKEEISQCLLKK